jgi:hypothetical protein
MAKMNPVQTAIKETIRDRIDADFQHLPYSSLPAITVPDKGSACAIALTVAHH